MPPAIRPGLMSPTKKHVHLGWVPWPWIHISLGQLAQALCAMITCWKDRVRGENEFGKSLHTDLQFLVYSNFQPLPPSINTTIQNKYFHQNPNHLEKPMKKQHLYFTLMTGPICYCPLKNILERKVDLRSNSYSGLCCNAIRFINL